MGFMVSKKTKKWAPLSAFVNVERVLQDASVIADSGRGRHADGRSDRPEPAAELLAHQGAGRLPSARTCSSKFDKQSGGQLGGKLGARDNENRKGDEWLLMFVAGMWFQDLWTYDFRRTEMCIIPYATQMGEISFCAYNTGVGWRQIVENMFQNAKSGTGTSSTASMPSTRTPTSRYRSAREHGRSHCTSPGMAGSSSGCRARPSRQPPRHRRPSRTELAGCPGRPEGLHCIERSPLVLVQPALRPRLRVRELLGGQRAGHHLQGIRAAGLLGA